MFEFYLLRHGQTLYNLNDHVQGFNDSPLTAKGLYQARCTGYGLRDTIFTKAYSGLCERQLDTARTFLSQNRQPLSIVPDIHFNEMNYGKYQDGSYYDMLMPLYDDLGLPYNSYQGLLEHYDHLTLATILKEKDETGQTEGPQACAQRFLQGLGKLVKENKNGKILIATSSLVIGATAHEIDPSLDMSTLVENASISIITYDGNYHLSDYNNISYRQSGEAHFNNDTL